MKLLKSVVCGMTTQETVEQTANKHIGARIRIARVERGLSQSELGRMLGLSFQQIQKYERGTNRISAGKLVHLATVLDMEVAAFFYDFENGIMTDTRRLIGSGLNAEFVFNYHAISCPEIKYLLSKLIKDLARKFGNCPM